MKSLSKSLRCLPLAAATLLLPPLLSSCQWMKEDFADEIDDSSAARYINITVSVSASNEAVTRANPTGGETGDGLEMGLDNENAVSNITLVFYEDGKGINTDIETTKVAFCKTYSVNVTSGGVHNHNNPEGSIWDDEDNVLENDANEIIYTTGDQKLEDNTLESSKTYHAIVIANAPESLTSQIVEDKTTIMEVRDMVVAAVFEGNGKGEDGASNFVMASERDAIVTFTNSKYDKDNNKITYFFDCIHIERLAARIDFWTKYGGTQTTPTDYTQAAWTDDKYKAFSTDENFLKGYDYTVFSDNSETNPSSNDHFLVVGFTPFNVSEGNEYIIKRTNDDANPYLHKESTTNWVLDPYSADDKKAEEYPAHIKYHLGDLKNATAVANSGLHLGFSDKSAHSEDGIDNIIVGYVRENVVKVLSPLFYYATGLAIEGYYFKDGATADGEHMVLYTFLRHQGESTTPYDAFTFSFDADADRVKTEDQVKNMKCDPNTAMNFGVVRNNIYRVSINRITKPTTTTELPKVTLYIKVKKWDKFVHTPIYM